jgi:deaminated glutathione amidase
MTRAITVAAIQTVSGTTVGANLQRFEALVNQAASEGAELAVLPEYFCLLGARETDKVEVAEADQDGPIQHWLATQAQRHRIWLIGGSVPLRSAVAGKIYNSLLAYGPDGRREARYDKIHLFGLTRETEQFDESRTITPGNEIKVLQTQFGRIGLSICYDLRFPELYRNMGPVDLILVPSAFTYTTGKAHWNSLLTARAIENQCFLIAAAQGGRHENGRRTWGHSLILDPWGVSLAELAEGEGIITARYDPERLTEVRKMLPALAHRTL